MCAEAPSARASKNTSSWRATPKTSRHICLKNSESQLLLWLGGGRVYIYIYAKYGMPWNRILLISEARAFEYLMLRGAKK